MKYVKYLIILFSILSNISFAEEPKDIKKTMIKEVAQKRGCSLKSPCDINIKEKENKYYVSANKTFISLEGILKYRPGGKVIYIYELNGDYIRYIPGR